MNIRRAPLIVALSLCVTLAACEQPTSNANEKIVATVGGELITENELNQALSRLGPHNEAVAAEVRSKVLEALIDQRLVAEAAKSTGLDKQPDVVRALQQVQRQVLFDAYMERIYKDMPKPTDAEINDYYSLHPELFSARKLYRIQEIELRMPSTRLAEVEARLKQDRSLATFSDWLKAQEIESKSGVGVKPAEQIPGVLLAQIKDMKDGQVTVLATGPESISVLQVLGSQAQPVTLEQARAAIERVVQSTKRKTLLGTELNKLRGQGKIEYASGFAPVDPATKAQALTTQPGS
jgi:EpsD family peptidyl-prolyl cis-trans isomerase